MLPVWLWGASHDAIWSERKAAICAAGPSWGPVKRLLLARPCASTANFRSCACESLASLGAWRSRLQAHEIAKGACWSTAAAHGPRQHGARTVRVRRSFWCCWVMRTTMVVLMAVASLAWAQADSPFYTTAPRATKKRSRSRVLSSVSFSLPPCGVCLLSAGAVGSFTINHFRNQKKRTKNNYS